MSDFTVSHETFGKTDSQRGCLELSESLSGLGLWTGEIVHDWRLGSKNSITIFAGCLRGDTPSVDNDYAPEKLEIG
jgi:hypothetical protein